MSRKILAVFMTAVIMLCGISVTAFADNSFTATLGYADSTWKANDWATTFTVTGDGTYSVTANCVSTDGVLQEGEGISVMIIDISGLGKKLGSATKNVTVSDVKVVTGGGASLAIDQSKVLFGDLESNGNLRIEIYNSFGRTKDPDLSPITPSDFSFKADEQFTITFTLSGLDAALAGESAETEAAVTTTAAATTTEAVTTTTTAVTTTTEAATTTTTTAETTVITEETTTTTEETTTVPEEISEETEEAVEEAETTTTTAATTTTTKATTTTEAETTIAETTTSAPEATTAAVQQAVASDSDYFASRNSSLMIFAIVAGVVILAAIIGFILISVKKKK